MLNFSSLMEVAQGRYCNNIVPHQDKIDKFIEETEKESGGIAVHCKAGLGRTGTLISCFAMKNYKITARAMIGWIRICRPGSVLGPQQHFLCDLEAELHAAPSKYGITVADLAKKMKVMNFRRLQGVSLSTEPSSVKMSAKDMEIAKSGQLGQAEGLRDKKLGHGGKKTG